MQLQGPHPPPGRRGRWIPIPAGLIVESYNALGSVVPARRRYIPVQAWRWEPIALEN